MIAPEISTAVTMLCRMTSRPTDEAITLAVRTMAYVHSKKDMGLVYRRVDKPGLLVYVDASNKGDPADGDKAQAGYIIFIGEGPVDWRSLRCGHVGLSAQHNEYMALAYACQAMVYLQYVLEDMGFDDWVKDGSVVLVDNAAAITLANEDLITAKNRFYSRLAHYAKECVEAGRADIRKVPTKENYSDGCTKNIDYDTFDEHLPMVRGYAAKPIVPPAPPKTRTHKLSAVPSRVTGELKNAGADAACEPEPGWLRRDSG